MASCYRLHQDLCVNSDQYNTSSKLKEMFHNQQYINKQQKLTIAKCYQLYIVFAYLDQPRLNTDWMKNVLAWQLCHKFVHLTGAQTYRAAHVVICKRTGLHIGQPMRINHLQVRSWLLPLA